MKGWGFLFVFQFLCLFLAAVRLETAFKKDWVSYGLHFVQHQIIAPDSVLGLSPNNVLYKVRASDTKVEYFIDLSLFRSDRFQVAGPYIVTYSASNPGVYVHRTSNGAFIESIQINECFTSAKYSSSGLFILLCDNELTLWNETSTLALGTFPANKFSVIENDDSVYVQINDSVFELTQDFQLVPPTGQINLSGSKDPEDFHSLQVPDSFVASGRSILVAKPDSIAKLEKVHHLEAELQTKSLLYRYVLRCKDHLVDLGKSVFDLLNSGNSEQFHSKDDEYHLGCILVFFDKTSSSLVAKDTTDGSIIWHQSLPIYGNILKLLPRGAELFILTANELLVVSLRDGSIVSTEPFSETIEEAFVFNEDLPFIGVRSGNSLKFLLSNETDVAAEYFLERHDNQLQGYKFSGDKIVSTWNFGSQNQKIVALSANINRLLNAVGIARHDRSVLYKFLHPNLVAVVAMHQEGLLLSLLNGVLGRIYFEQVISQEKLVLDSVKLVQEDNWVVVSYTVLGKNLEQRITVFDLFTDSLLTKQKEVSSFDSLPMSVTSKTFIYPELITALAATRTKFGITTKSVLAFTKAGNLVEIPKYVLNSRRIDNRVMTQNDFMDDFRMMPYEPVIQKDTLKVLNHKVKLLSDGADLILVLPSELESTAVVCLINSHNQFCSIVQPSLSYDVLPASFQKVALLLTIAALFVAYVASKPFVYSKKLNQKWVD